MKTVRMPGFKADASLYRTEGGYQRRDSGSERSSANTVSAARRFGSGQCCERCGWGDDWCCRPCLE
jgi:hypothetical protein